MTDTNEINHHILLSNMYRFNIFASSILSLILLLAGGCSKNDDPNPDPDKPETPNVTPQPDPEPDPEPIEYGPLSFIGDSLIAMWKLEECFPDREYENYGVSGYKILNLTQFAGQFTNKDVVLIAGTNDIPHLYRKEYSLEEYVERYWNVIESLDAHKIYLYSILPREDNSDTEINRGINSCIDDVNAAIKNSLYEHPNVVYIDVHDLYHDGDGVNKEYYRSWRPDLLHLSTEGYKILTKALEDTLLSEYTNK